MVANIENYQKILQELKIKSPKTRLLVVTKNKSLAEISPFIECGHNLFGENKVQEARQKFSDDFLANNTIDLHLIGPLQTNKALDALKLFSTIQSIDRVKLVEVIVDAKEKLAEKMITQNFYIQVNIGDEPQKSGVSIKDLRPLYQTCLQRGLNIEGLMCIPPINQSPNKYFELLFQLKNQINQSLKLSMGMSQDYHKALSYQTDMIRIGSFLFNE